MLGAANNADGLRRPPKFLEELPVRDRNRLNKPGSLPEKLADRAMLVVVYVAGRIGVQLAARKNSWRQLRAQPAVATDTAIIVAGLAMLAAPVVRLSGQQVQSLSHGRHKAVQDGQGPSQTNLPTSAHDRPYREETRRQATLRIINVFGSRKQEQWAAILPPRETS
jgi:hypothetical protein